MQSAGLDERPSPEPDAPGPRRLRRLLDPTRNLWLLPTIAATAWAVVTASLGTMARLATSSGSQPSWGEVIAATAYNFALVFVGVLVLSLAIRLVVRRRRRNAEPEHAGMAQTRRTGGIRERTLRGHPVIPTTTEGRWAVVASLLAVVPFVGGPAMFAAPVLFILAWRRGDRAWLLLLPVLVAVFLVFFLVAEFTIGHE